jgi:hypothetical protein
MRYKVKPFLGNANQRNFNIKGENIALIAGDIVGRNIVEKFTGAAQLNLFEEVQEVEEIPEEKKKKHKAK